jgi:hypothetical protein
MNRIESHGRKEREEELSLDEEQLPNLIEEKRQRELVSRRIAFGEGL